MANFVFSLPEGLSFSIGVSDSSTTASKSKLVKKVKKQRLPIKRSFWKSVGQSAKVASRALVRIQSSAHRQGKFAKARSRPGEAVIAETK